MLEAQFLGEAGAKEDPHVWEQLVVPRQSRGAQGGSCGAHCSRKGHST